jgi:hypothetical protein
MTHAKTIYTMAANNQQFYDFQKGQLKPAARDTAQVLGNLSQFALALDQFERNARRGPRDC